MLFTDLATLKSVLDIDPNNANEDQNLLIWTRYATDWISELMNRDFSYKVRTVYYSGTNTQKLVLRHRPVYPLVGLAQAVLPFQPLTVIIDEYGAYGYAPNSFQNNPDIKPLTLGVDYTINPDQDDGGSREAILYAINRLWPKPWVRAPGLLSPYPGISMGPIQVQYTAGYTVDTLPPILRLAAEKLVGSIRYLFPLGVQLSSEGYEERSISLALQGSKTALLGDLPAICASLRNWKM